MATVEHSVETGFDSYTCIDVRIKLLNFGIRGLILCTVNKELPSSLVSSEKVSQPLDDIQFLFVFLH